MPDFTDPKGKLLKPSGSAEDSVAPLDAGGPPTHAHEFSAGRLIPGPTEQPVGSVGPFDGGSAEDAVRLVGDNGPGYHEAPAVGAGVEFGELEVTSSSGHGEAGTGGSYEDTTELLSSVLPGYHEAPIVAAGFDLPGAEGRGGSSEDVLFADLILSTFLPGGYDWGSPSSPDGIPIPLRGAVGGGSLCVAEFCAEVGFHPLSGALDPNNYRLEEIRSGRQLLIVRAEKVPGDVTKVNLLTEEFPRFPIQHRLTIRRVENVSGEPLATPLVAFFTSEISPHQAVAAPAFFYGLEAGFQSETELAADVALDPVIVTAVDPIEGGFADEDTNVTLRVQHVAAGPDGTSVDVDLNVDGGALVPVYRGATGAQSGYAVAINPVANGFEYVINPNVDLLEDKQIGIFVRATDLSAEPFAVSTSYQFKILKKFGIFTAVQTEDFDLILTFVDDLEQSGAAGVALLDPASYQLNTLGLGVPETVTAIQVISPTSVKLTIGLTTRDEPYQVELLGALATSGLCGEIITGGLGNYVSTTTLPTIARIEALSGTLVRVTFSREMKNNIDLIDVSKYRFNGGVFAVSIVRTSPTTVEVTTSRQLPGRQYTLNVFP